MKPTPIPINTICCIGAGYVSWPTIAAIAGADMVFISVNTPTKTKGLGAGQASDLKWVEASARTVTKAAQGHTIVVEKSTPPEHTSEAIHQIQVTRVSRNIIRASPGLELPSNRTAIFYLYSVGKRSLPQEQQPSQSITSNCLSFAQKPLFDPAGASSHPIAPDEDLTLKCQQEQQNTKAASGKSQTLNMIAVMR